MRAVLVMLTVFLLGALVWVLTYLGRGTPTPAVVAPATATAPSPRPPLRLGLIPERDIFQYRAAYKALGDYLGTKLGRRVELRTVNSYEGVLQDFAEKEVDGAFLGSLVAALVCDRYGGQVLAKPEYVVQGNEVASTYRGVIFVPEDSPVRRFEDLSGRTLALVRTTTAGNLFSTYEMMQMGMLEAPQAPTLVWVGTHDDVVREVLAGRAEAGATKDLRLDAFLQQNPGFRVRRLATSEPVPENGLVVRGDLPAELVEGLRQALLEMDRDPAAEGALTGLNLRRFVPCEIHDYKNVYDMVEAIGPAWERMGVQGPAPRRPVAKGPGARGQGPARDGAATEVGSSATRGG